MGQPGIPKVPQRAQCEHPICRRPLTTVSVELGYEAGYDLVERRTFADLRALLAQPPGQNAPQPPLAPRI